MSRRHDRLGRQRAIPRLWPWTLLVALELGGFVVIAVYIAVSSQRASPLDEVAHLSYTHYIAVEHRLPVLGRDYHPEPVLAYAFERYPGPSGADPRMLGFGGYSYEAFQPPLYYVVEVPAFLISPDYRVKIKAMRVEGVLLAAIAGVALLFTARRVAGRAWPLAAAFGLLALLMPAVLVRTALLGQFSLELLLVTVLVLAALHTDRARGRWGVSISVALLAVTALQMAVLLVPSLALAMGEELRARGWRRTGVLVAAGHLLPAAVTVLPWLAFNWVTYHALTAGQVAIQMQTPIIHPGHNVLLPRDALAGLLGILHQAFPDEWGASIRSSPVFLAVDLVSPALLVVLPLTVALLLADGESPGSGTRAAILAGPFVVVAATLAVAGVILNWPTWLPRYAGPAVPALALAFPNGTGVLRWRPGLALAAVTAFAALLAGVDADLGLRFGGLPPR